MVAVVVEVVEVVVWWAVGWAGLVTRLQYEVCYVVLCHCLQQPAHLVSHNSQPPCQSAVTTVGIISDYQILSHTSHLVSCLSPLLSSQLSDSRTFFPALSGPSSDRQATKISRAGSLSVFPSKLTESWAGKCWCWPCIGCKSPRCHQVLRSLRGASQYGEVRISGYTTTVYNHHNLHTDNS